MAYTFKHGDRPLDGYTIQRAVGRGGFGEVYYAISDGGREVALKYLRDNPQVELRGVSNCINLKSPHLVSIFDVKKADDGNYVIIMEYCSGPSLRDLLIAEPNGFGPQKAAFFAREIAKGLSYLHDRGIVHRDLKPGNIFYDDGYVKIGDYGLSKFISVSRHSAQTVSVGTVHYMAPEIGSGNYSRGVDIYALGVILYEMLMGKVPFEGSSMAEILMKHLTTQPEVDNLPRPFGDVIRRSLEKDPNNRYQTIEDMMGELLEAEGVKQSLVGFSPQSLEGAIRAGETLTVHSPIPSPNPMPHGPHGDAPAGPPPPLPDKVARRMDRISHKIDKKIGKLGGRSPAQAAQSPPFPQRGEPRQPATEPQRRAATDRRKRIGLTFVLATGLAVGLGVLVGVWSNDDEAGVSAAMLALALPGSVLLGDRLLGWFDVRYGPKWAEHLLRLACSAPLLAIAAAPIMDRHGEEGVAVWLGLLIVAVFANWERHLDRASVGEMSIGTACWTAFGALVATAIAAGIMDGDPEEMMFIAAGVAGVASLVVQASSWWHMSPAGTVPPLPGVGAHTPVTAPPEARRETAGIGGVTPPSPPHAGTGQRASERGSGIGSAHTGHQAQSRRTLDGKPRWLLTRAFWSLVAFGAMGGSIFLFVATLIAVDWNYHDRTAGILGCIALASFMLFAVRRTGPIKRAGFWRETLRPLLITVSMFGIGATITGIAREWGHVSYKQFCVSDEGAAALITGLVLCSILFVVLVLFTGRRRRAEPTVEAGMGSYVLDEDDTLRPHEMRQPAPGLSEA